MNIFMSVFIRNTTANLFLKHLIKRKLLYMEIFTKLNAGNAMPAHESF